MKGLDMADIEVDYEPELLLQSDAGKSAISESGYIPN